MSASAASGLSRATETGLLSDAASATNLSAALGSAAGEDASPSRLRQGSAGSRSASGSAGAGGASGDAAAAMLPGLSVEEATAMRAKLNGLSADVLTLRGEREGLNRALGARDRELLVRCCACAGGVVVSGGEPCGRWLAHGVGGRLAGARKAFCVVAAARVRLCSTRTGLHVMRCAKGPWLSWWRVHCALAHCSLDSRRTPYSSVVTVSLADAHCVVCSTPFVRLQNLRNRLQEVEAAAAVQAEGLRKRGAGVVGAAAAADDEDERDAKTHGFPLWQLLLVAVVFFLLGRLSNSWV
jgi:hypothetical protein